jgi:hypothetical protein
MVKLVSGFGNAHYTIAHRGHRLRAPNRVTPGQGKRKMRL